MTFRLGGMTPDLPELVRNERNRRGWSVRTAAAHGKVSNTTWGRIEEGDPLTPRMRVCVATAFDWPTDWPENPPTPPPSDLAHVLALVDKLTQSLDQLGAAQQQLAARLARLERLVVDAALERISGVLPHADDEADDDLLVQLAALDAQMVELGEMWAAREIDRAGWRAARDRLEAQRSALS